MRYRVATWMRARTEARRDRRALRSWQRARRELSRKREVRRPI